MIDLSNVDWNSVATGFLSLVVLALAWVGRRVAEGKPAIPGMPSKPKDPTAGTAVVPAVEVNALVDSKTLTVHASAIEALNLTQAAGQKQNKEIALELIAAINGLSKDIRSIGYALDKANSRLEGLDEDIRGLTLEVVRHSK